MQLYLSPYPSLLGVTVLVIGLCESGDAINKTSMNLFAEGKHTPLYHSLWEASSMRKNSASLMICSALPGVSLRICSAFSSFEPALSPAIT